MYRALHKFVRNFLDKLSRVRYNGHMLKVEIKQVLEDGRIREQLWINGKWNCTQDGRIDGNMVGHNTCRVLRDMGIDATCKLTPLPGRIK